MLSDPSSGETHMQMLKSDRSVANQLDQHWLGARIRRSLGRFGLPIVSVMLYDPQQARSTFIAFDAALNVSHQ